MKNEQQALPLSQSLSSGCLWAEVEMETGCDNAGKEGQKHKSQQQQQNTLQVSER
jgi:hypothetical protein